MAEIRIEKKKPIWPWIILILIILAILYFLLYADDDNGNDDRDDYNTEQVEDTVIYDRETRDTGAWDTDPNRDTLSNVNYGTSDYLAYIGDDSRMGVDHEYTNNAIIELMNALQTKAREQNINIDADMEEVRKDTHKITQDPQASNHAGTIKNAGTRITNVMQKIQQQKYPNLSREVEEVSKAVNNINPSVQTLQQKDQIQSFFDRAADVLQKMN